MSLQMDHLKKETSSIKAIAEEYISKVWNHKDLSAIDKFIHRGVIIHSLLGDFHGIDAMREVIQTWWKGFPDLRITTSLIISKGDIVSIQWQAKGTHQGEFKGRPPKGKVVSFSGAAIYRIRNRKIVEYWAYLDMHHLFSQL